MEQKEIPAVHPPHAGFQAPPAYEQYQNYPQNYPQPLQGQPGVYQGQPGVYQGQPQVVTSKSSLPCAVAIFLKFVAISVITSSPFGFDPLQLTCPSCRNPVTTRVDYEPSTKTHLMAGLMCLLFWPCFCLPYMIDSCKNANHYCPHCSAYIGTYRGS